MKTPTKKIRRYFLVVLVIALVSCVVFLCVRALKEHSLSRWPSIEIPGYTLTAYLLPNPESIPTEASSPNLMLSVRKRNGSIYKEIPIPYESSLGIYAADSEHVYIGGQAPNVRSNILIVDINTSQVKQLYFGLDGSEGRAEGMLFNENAWYMAYLDKKYDGSSTKLLIHNMQTNKDKIVATWSKDYVPDYHWNGMALAYTTESGEKISTPE